VQAGAHARPVGLTGVTLYEPEELILTRAGTPLAEIEALLMAAKPGTGLRAAGLRARCSAAPAGAADHRRRDRRNLAGPRRIKAGAARDHFLGFTRRQRLRRMFKAGGRVVKNVTGYDLLQAARRLLGHAGGADDGDAEGAAGAETSRRPRRSPR
jgi:glycolate oxidase FAD binding subunit